MIAEEGTVTPTAVDDFQNEKAVNPRYRGPRKREAERTGRNRHLNAIIKAGAVLRLLGRETRARRVRVCRQGL